jgi:hypothetical protein
VEKLTLGIVPGLMVLTIEHKRTPSPRAAKKSSSTSRPVAFSKLQMLNNYGFAMRSKGGGGCHYQEDSEAKLWPDLPLPSL